ncbi:MAG TPA: hypothetical protein DD379_13720 [Cyanobacteria bacterium UBA11162]|nr:hypothetical protein [Cyanobacteria bacterium UBA11162]
MLNYNPLEGLPSAEDLPDSDDIAPTNQLEHLVPALLEATLALLWAERWDWYFGVDMGVYYDPKKSAVVPDGFLSIGVERFIDEDLRLCYVLWEDQVVPLFVLEVVFYHRTGEEYMTKKNIYEQIGILYYVIYNPGRPRRRSLEVYQLVDGVYQLLSGNPVWLPEINLGIGAERGTYQGLNREWVYWYDQQGNRYLTPEERIQQAEQRAQRLVEQLRELGVDRDALP